MAKIQSLNASKREGRGTALAKKLRRNGKVPGVIYGGHQENYGVTVDFIALRDLLSKSATQNVLVRLDIEGAREQNKLALIQAVQHHPLNGKILNVDFHAVSEDETIVASVPINLRGDSIGVHKGGILDQQLHSLEVRCIPASLPEAIKGDITNLDLGQPFHVNELEWPEGVEPVVGMDVVVALVVELRGGKKKEDEGSAA